MAKILKRIKKKVNHKIERTKLKRKDDETLVERAVELVEEDKEIATQILGMVKNPNTKISGLSDLHESLDSENIKDVVDTLEPEEKPLLFEQEDVVKEIKNFENTEGTVIIKEAISKTKNIAKRLDRLYSSTDVLGDYDVISVLKAIQEEKYENKKLVIISKKIASNYARFGTSMHIRELSECLKSDKLRREIPSQTAEEFQKLKKKRRNKNRTREEVANKIQELLEDENLRYVEGEKIKEERDKTSRYRIGQGR